MFNKSERTTYCGGTFDILHYGHVCFLMKCAQYGAVTVSLNTDEFIQEYKGKPPLYSYQERESMLTGLPWVERVVPNIGGTDSKPAIEIAQPDIIAIGSDWARRDYYAQMGFTQDWLDERGIDLVYIPYTRGISSSDIKQRVTNRIVHHYKSQE